MSRAISNHEGPWWEPDQKDWEAHGLKCALRRGPSGHWCGYVGVPSTHPAFGIDYDSDMLDYIEVHGGLTFASSHPCHLPDSGLHWLGFECLHLDDFWPTNPGSKPEYVLWNPIEVYRDIYYATVETEHLAEQLAAMMKEGSP